MKGYLLFNKIHRPSRIYNEVALQIEEAIISKKLDIGDRLPSERELAETFDISRRTLRESLRVVEQKGLIEIRPAGAFVVMKTNEKISQSLALAIRTQKLSWRDIAEFRKEVEGRMILHAIRNATENDIVNLEKITAEMESLLRIKKSFEWENFLNLDKKFHLYLAKMAGNPIYDLILQTFLSNLGIYYEAYRHKKDEFSQDNLVNLKKITQAIQNRDPKNALKLVEDHFDLGTVYMNKKKAK